MNFQPPSGFISIESTTSPPTQAPYRYPEYDEVEIITAPPLGGHRHYGPTYEVQVIFFFIKSFLHKTSRIILYSEEKYPSLALSFLKMLLFSEFLLKDVSQFD